MELPSIERPTRVRYLVLAALCMAAVLAYIHRGCLAVPKETIRAQLHMSDVEMDQVLSAFFLGYALFQIPGGWLGDRLGMRRGLTIFLVIWSLATGCMSLAGGFLALFSLHMLNGMAQAGIFPCCVKSFSQWFPSSARAFPSGALGSCMSVGGALATFLTGLLVLVMPWESMLAALAFPGLLFALWFYSWFRDRPEEHDWVSSAEKQLIEEGRGPRVSASAEREPMPWGTALTSGRLGLICGQQFFRAAAYIFYTTQFPSFLQRGRGLSESLSGYLASLPLLGVVLGSVTGGLAMDLIVRKTGKITLSRKGIALAGTLGGASFLGCAFLVENLTLMMVCIVTSMFCAGMTGPAGYTVTIDQGGRHVATVFSIMNTAGNVGATILPVALGAFVRWTDNWNYALVAVASLYALAAVCWAFLPIQGSIFPAAPREPPSEAIQEDHRHGIR